jgi:anti-sigma factor RsiW
VSIPQPEMTCQELVELVTEYLEDALPVNQRALFEAHLATCRGCRNFLNQMRQSISETQRLTENSLPVPVRDELLMLFRDWKKNA